MERLRQRILYIYPDVKINYFNDVIDKCSDTTKLLTLLSNLRKNDDRFIIIEHLKTNTFREFANKLLGDDERINKGLNDYSFIIMRSKAISISMDDPDELDFILKQVLNKKQTECHICYDEMIGECVRCYHCKSDICFTCAQKLFDTTAYWCGFCGHHYLFQNLGKPRDIEQDVTELEFHIRQLIQQCKQHITDSHGKLLPHTIYIGLPVETCGMFHGMGATIADFDEDYLQNMKNVDVRKH